MEWKAIALLIEPIERREALGNDRRVVSVATNAKHLPGVDENAKKRFHPGTFGGWLLEAAELEGDLVAVVRLTDRALVGVTAEGKEVEVAHG